MEIRYLKEFVVLVEEGYYANAAEQLFISPSSLTRHIQTIEKEIGEPLFQRTARKAKLTTIGNEYYKYARKIVDLQERFMDENIVNKRRDKKIIVGYREGIAQCEVLEWVSSFRYEHPEIDLEFTYASSEHQFDILSDNKCDFLLTECGLIPQDRFESIICIKDEYAFAVSYLNKMAKRKSITISELPLEKIAVVRMFSERYSGYMEVIKNEPSYRNIDIIEESQAIGCVVLENKIVLMPKLQAEKWGDPVSVMELLPPATYEVALIYRKGGKLSDKEKIFLEFFRQHASVV